MTTQSWSTRIRHDTTALFREWGLELSTKLAAAGLVKTSDTGQINWTTVNRPGVNADGGYEVWRFNDTQQSTAPIFIKIYYGTGASASAPRVSVAVGIASNGSGTVTTIGGGAATKTDISGASSDETTNTLRNSYLCVAEGFLGLNWKQGSAGSNEGLFLLCRSSDAAGVPDADGVIMVTGSVSGSAIIVTQCMRFAATAQLYTSRNSPALAMLGFIPQYGDNGSSLVGSDFQLAVGWMITPRVRPAFGIAMAIPADFAVGNTAAVALVGSTSRTYIALGSLYSLGPQNGFGNDGFLRAAMLWE